MIFLSDKTCFCDDHSQCCWTGGPIVLVVLILIQLTREQHTQGNCLLRQLQPSVQPKTGRPRCPHSNQLRDTINQSHNGQSLHCSPLRASDTVSTLCSVLITVLTTVLVLELRSTLLTTHCIRYNGRLLQQEVSRGLHTSCYLILPS
jgi:hypothetical protein